MKDKLLAMVAEKQLNSYVDLIDGDTEFKLEGSTQVGGSELMLFVETDESCLLVSTSMKDSNHGWLTLTEWRSHQCSMCNPSTLEEHFERELNRFARFVG